MVALEEDDVSVTGKDIGQKCRDALNMIDELMNQQDDEFGFDEALLLKKDSSYTIGPDGTRMTTINEEEIRKIKERVEAEKQ